MRKKATRKRPYFTMESAMTGILRDVSGKMHPGILFSWPKQKNVLVVLVTRVFLFGPVSVEKCNHRHTILGRKWAQLFEGRFSLTRGVISFSFVLKHFLRQFSPFFPSIQLSNCIQKE